MIIMIIKFVLLESKSLQKAGFMEQVSSQQYITDWLSSSLQYLLSP